MRPKIALLDDGSDDIKDRLNELKHSDAFDICGVCTQGKNINGLRTEVFDNISNMLLLTQPDVLAIHVKDELIIPSFKIASKQCKNIIISRLAPLPLEALHELNTIAKESQVTAVLDIPHRFHPVILSLKKALLKEEKIYSINITGINPKAASIVALLVNNIDLASFIVACGVSGGQDLSCSILARDSTYSQACLKLIMPKGLALCMHCSMLGPVARHFIEVSTSGGIYFADLLGKKLYMSSEMGQINLKVDTDSSEVRSQYKAFRNYFTNQNNTQNTLASIEDIIKIKELFA